MTVQNQVARALEIARRIGAERPGPARSERQTERLSSAIEAAPLVALGPDSTDQTAQARDPFPYTIEYLYADRWRSAAQTRTLNDVRRFAHGSRFPIRVWLNGELVWEYDGGS